MTNDPNTTGNEALLALYRAGDYNPEPVAPARLEALTLCCRIVGFGL
ncbi:MAG: hypothetical protein U5J83_18110 [Bryobacterales bacterium]|nr:hypothetical protein [Bryobacterales bacterium]